MFQPVWHLSPSVFVSPAPSPTTAVHYLATKCVDTIKHRQETKWFMPWGPNQCDKIRTFDEAMAKKIEANNIVFAVHIPLPNKEMSPWFQFMLVILQFDIAFKMYNQIGEKQLSYRFHPHSLPRIASFHAARVTCMFVFVMSIFILVIFVSQSASKYLELLNDTKPASQIFTSVVTSNHSRRKFKCKVLQLHQTHSSLCFFCYVLCKLLSCVLGSVYHDKRLRNPQECVFLTRLDCCYTERQQTMINVLLLVLYSGTGPGGSVEGLDRRLTGTKRGERYPGSLSERVASEKWDDLLTIHKATANDLHNLDMRSSQWSQHFSKFPSTPIFIVLGYDNVFKHCYVSICNVNYSLTQR